MKKASEAIAVLTDGVLSYAVDVSLWFVAFSASLSVPQSSVGQVYRAQVNADRFLNRINYETIKQGIAEARRRGLLKKTTRGRRAWPEITKAGEKRLQGAIPQYDSKRVWDGQMHLVTYDIPEVKSRDRALLREYLRRIGCARLQNSVWITPYDPIDILRDFVREKSLQGTIIVSRLGKDGSIGDENLKDLIVRVYFLENLNKRYADWLDESRKKLRDMQLILQYLAILRDDPQLPFSLLPSWWLGERAHEIFWRIEKELVIKNRSGK